jgi:hypothetical protein
MEIEMELLAREFENGENPDEEREMVLNDHQQAR